MSNETPNEGQQAALIVFTNDRSEEHLGVLHGLLKMVYHAALTNQLGLMEARNDETGETELVIVGIRQNGSGLDCYPMFKPITDVDAGKYSAPDGSGGFVSRTPEETAE